MGSGTPQNLTPRPQDVTGLSYTTLRPVGVKYTETTLQAVNATGQLKAVVDNPKIGHVSVTPIEYPASAKGLEDWIKSRPTANTNPHPLTVTLQRVSINR